MTRGRIRAFLGGNVVSTPVGRDDGGYVALTLDAFQNLTYQEKPFGGSLTERRFLGGPYGFEEVGRHTAMGGRSGGLAVTDRTVAFR